MISNDFFSQNYRYNGIAAPYNNARRQLTVNDRAEYKGTGTGTARYEGVPGSGNDFGYYRYNHGYDRGYNRGYGGYDGYDYGYGRYWMHSVAK